MRPNTTADTFDTLTPLNPSIPMPIRLEIRPPRPPTKVASDRRNSITRLRHASGWLPAGAAIILALSALLVVIGQHSTSAPAPTVRQSAPPTEARDTRIDINTATVPELQTLPGIGTSRAQAIIRLRAQQPFRSLAELVDLGVLTTTEARRISELAAAYVNLD